MPGNDWLASKIVLETQDAVIFADRDEVIRLWNSGAEVMFGYTATEAVGQRLPLIIPEKLRQRHSDGYRKVMETGVTKYGRDLLAVPATRKDGTRISIEFTILLVRDGNAAVQGAAAIIRDVTKRWQEERALRARLAELEAKAG
ncbi:MAG: PAS domain S-box protein [Deltaproteobacteria bacterium]|nr:PAS domain S-box protein [Deltaproteobacteria bacterium]